ncbi:ECF transporter S component family protein [Aestuariimicrobium ganziense]|uniref:ECF transporter S component n=1 Tax=Aestuariimicrobium ganziense TaxID=2773677 RepID=UPI002E2B4FC2|nr:ECF transporter S component [Aestuariimicrobium ganziense]
MADNPALPRSGVRQDAVRLSPRSRVLLAVAALLGALAFTWPLLLDPGATLAGDDLAPLLFALVLPVVLAVVVAQLTGDDLDVKALAMLGVMSAVVAAVRPLGAGTAGIETVFFPIIISARVFGPGFGFVLGNTGLLASALITAGVGPWLPHQMLAAGFVGLLTGLLPRLRGRAEIALLAAWAILASVVYGWLMDLSFWPFMVGGESTISFDPADGTLANLHRFVVFNLATSMGWNVGRALTTAALVILLGPALLRILRRAARRASFG